MTHKNRFCPNCSSEDVEPDMRHTNVLGQVVFNPDKWYCPKCDYTGIMPEKGFENKEDVEFEPSEQEKIDTDVGEAHLWFYKEMLYITLGFILGIIMISTANSIM